MKLSSDKEHLVLDNQRLVHYLVQKLGVAPNSSDYELFGIAYVLGIDVNDLLKDIRKKF